jgi:hypothetical protein
LVLSGSPIWDVIYVAGRLLRSKVDSGYGYDRVSCSYVSMDCLCSDVVKRTGLCEEWGSVFPFSTFGLLSLHIFRYWSSPLGSPFVKFLVQETCSIPYCTLACLLFLDAPPFAFLPRICHLPGSAGTRSSRIRETSPPSSNCSTHYDSFEISNLSV